MSESLAHVTARKLEDLTRRFEAHERRHAECMEAIAIEIARIREHCGIPASPSNEETNG